MPEVPNSTSTRGHPRTMERECDYVLGRYYVCIPCHEEGVFYCPHLEVGKNKNPKASWDTAVRLCPAGHSGKTCSEQDLLTPDLCCCLPFCIALADDTCIRASHAGYWENILNMLRYLGSRLWVGCKEPSLPLRHQSWLLIPLPETVPWITPHVDCGRLGKLVLCISLYRYNYLTRYLSSI